MNPPLPDHRIRASLLEPSFEAPNLAMKAKKLHPESDMLLILKDNSKLSVSSAIMANASEIFTTIFATYPLERDDGSSALRKKIILPGDDAKAMTTLCAALHHAHNSLGSEVPSLEQLREIALIVDKYQCGAAALRPAFARWLPQALGNVRGNSDRTSFGLYGDLLAFARLLDNPALFYACECGV
ncbi:uncharacterized protein K452DRAFT_323087 [Aplosporella prunicola CBS 121167]|uniref:BTB domain-containing protein n=1 Tax=Aplosporella prunicola CBS 121167 TaxID=1176127 RepID=A0A6A6AVW4_9PEZI|nr:uncharacterized protein K452DRAFT_323087 [Aplosporella prunicola CBS 121167]KAF2135378.1 hypothetical protein K452DRAFT_323087 [Aplosporella prunicola CBS 121167]